MTGETSRKRPEQTYSWLELYEAKSVEVQAKLPSERPRGRPRRTMITKKHTVYLTTQEWEMLERWQQTLSRMMGRLVSTGETAGILARIISERYDGLGMDREPGGMHELVSLLVEANPDASPRGKGGKSSSSGSSDSTGQGREARNK